LPSLKRYWRKLDEKDLLKLLGMTKEEILQILDTADRLRPSGRPVKSTIFPPERPWR
jgi:ornithine carbamoyltransferase